MELPDYGGTDGIICVEKDLIGQDTYAKVQTDIYSVLTESFQVSEDGWNSDVTFRVTGSVSCDDKTPAEVREIVQEKYSDMMIYSNGDLDITVTSLHWAHYIQHQ